MRRGAVSNRDEIRGGKLTATHAIEDALRQIQAVEPRLHATLEVYHASS